MRRKNKGKSKRAKICTSSDVHVTSSQSGKEQKLFYAHTYEWVGKKAEREWEMGKQSASSKHTLHEYSQKHAYTHSLTHIPTSEKCACILSIHCEA